MLGGFLCISVILKYEHISILQQLSLLTITVYMSYIVYNTYIDTPILVITVIKCVHAFGSTSIVRITIHP